MKNYPHFVKLFLFGILLFLTSEVKAQGRRTGSPGQAFEVQLTPYKTTMKADGRDTALIDVKIIDNLGNIVKTANNTVTFTATGKGKIIRIENGDQPPVTEPVNSQWQISVNHGECRVILQTTTERGAIKFEAKSDSLWTGSTDIEAVWPGIAHPVTNIDYKPQHVNGRILGADISFLPNSKPGASNSLTMGYKKIPYKY